jgi:hypothetical protein
MTQPNIKKYFLTTLLMLVVSFSYAQMSAPSDPGGNPELGPPLGGGAPIGGGIGILLTLGAAYGAKKVYSHFKENLENLEE